MGWLTNVAPSLVAFQPSEEPSASVWLVGVPSDLTTVVQAPGTGADGVAISLYLVWAGSCTRCTAAASTPSTLTESTVRPSKSRENDDKGAPVVAAVIVVVATMDWSLLTPGTVAGVQTMFTS